MAGERAEERHAAADGSAFFASLALRATTTARRALDAYALVVIADESVEALPPTVFRDGAIHSGSANAETGGHDGSRNVILAAAGGAERQDEGQKEDATNSPHQPKLPQGRIDTSRRRREACRRRRLALA